MPFKLPPLPSPMLFEFAALCAAVYEPQETSVGRFTRTEYRAGSFGFQGAIYCSGSDWVISYAGTNTHEWGDLLSDAGFGNGFGGLIGGPILLGPAAWLMTKLGGQLLGRHLAQAEELLAAARAAAGVQARMYVCGHSLGGGIAQVIGARHSVKSVAISPPVVTGVSGIEGHWSDVDHIVYVRVAGDPINLTDNIGHCIGRMIALDTDRRGKPAHDIAGTLAELSPGGRSAEIGARDPFGATHTPIDRKYTQLLQSGLHLGEPKGPEVGLEAGGTARHYVNGSIFHHPSTGAFEVHGSILSQYLSMGATLSTLGYPTSDEKDLPDGSGRYNDFQFGVISWDRGTCRIDVLEIPQEPVLHPNGVVDEVDAPAPQAPRRFRPLRITEKTPSSRNRFRG